MPLRPQCVPGHPVIACDGKVNELARQGSLTPNNGIEPAVGLSKLMVQNHLSHWGQDRSVKRQHSNKIPRKLDRYFANVRLCITKWTTNSGSKKI